jgi:WD40 repeat protein
MSKLVSGARSTTRTTSDSSPSRGRPTAAPWRSPRTAAGARTSITGRDEIILLDVRTKKIRDVPNLPEGPKTAIAWSPDGSTLAYAGREGHDSVYSTNNLHLYVCDPKTGNVRNLLAKTDYCMLAVMLSDTSEAAFSPSLRFSPDSKRIYMKLGWHGQAHIASVGRRGGVITFHTKGNVDFDLGTIDDACEKVAITRNRVDQLAEIGVASMRTGPVRRDDAHPLQPGPPQSTHAGENHFVVGEDG